MKYWKLAILAFLSGCAAFQPPPPRIETVTTTFAIPGHMNERGSLAVQSPDPALNKSLEFAHYRQAFEERLSAQGYAIEHEPKKAKYIAFVSYGIDSGRVETVTTPVYGQVGGGPTFTSGMVMLPGGKMSSFSGTAYTMPTFGMVGTATDSITRFTRVIALDIVDAASLKSSEPRKVYEIRAKSIGSCGNFIDVFDAILTGMFSDWPGVPGKSQSSQVLWTGRCTGRQ